MTYVAATVTKEYFIGEILIPNLAGSLSINTALQAEISWFIAKYQPEYLKLLLGEDFYAEYFAAIAVQSHNAKWDTLANQIYDSTNKISPVAAYVYYFFMLNSSTLTVTTGEAQSTYDNATLKANHTKVCRSWNWMVDRSEEIKDWLDERKSTYTTWARPESMEKINTFGI